MLRVKPTLLAVALAAAPSVQASDIQINGFMNVIAGVSSNDEIDVSGYDESISYTQDSLMGLQFHKRVNDSTSATVQLVARGLEGFNAEAAWAYVTYEVDDNTDIRMGRFRTPLYHYSDFLEVGYAYNWVKPSSLLYVQSELSSMNGADITRRFTVGGNDASVQAYVARFGGDIMLGPDSYEMNLKDSVGLVFNIATGDFSTRLSVHKASLSIDVDPAGDRGLDHYLAGAIFLGFGDEYTVDDLETYYYQTSLTYDNGSTSAIAEWTYLTSDSALLNDTTSYMVGAAQRFGEATTVHLTYAAKEDVLESGAVGQLQKGGENKESSIILGVRYDYDTSTALKLEAEHNDEEIVVGADGESGMLYRVGVNLVF